MFKRTLSLSNYELFEMPGVFKRRARPKWTRDDALEYFEWFMRIKDARITQLLRACGAEGDVDLSERSRKIGAILHRSLGEFFIETPRGKDVNGLGIIVGFDASLVIGEALISSVENTAWRIMSSKIKDLVSNHLTVVIREGGLQAFEPFWEGRLLLTLCSRLEDASDANVVKEKFEMWKISLLAPDSARVNCAW